MARIVVPGTPHHITQRGNDRQDVFFTDDDRRFYLHTLAEQCRLANVRVIAYCLMPNHVHVVATPTDTDGLARAIGRTHLRYALYINRQHGRSGHLWQNRFFSAAMDDAHTVAAVRYVERNPVRAGFVGRAWDYPWSSAAAHCGRAWPHRVLSDGSWSLRYASDEWMSMLSAPADEDLRRSLRRESLRGRPMGSDRFIAQVEASIGRRVRASPVGRPPGGGASS